MAAITSVHHSTIRPSLRIHAPVSSTGIPRLLSNPCSDKTRSHQADALHAPIGPLSHPRVYVCRANPPGASSGLDESLTEYELNVRRRKPLHQRYNVIVDRAITSERLQELQVFRWSRWWSPGPCAYMWDWQVDEEVVVVSGQLRVTPYESEESFVLTAGDYARFPKWFLAELEFSGAYEQRYRFRAYGDP